MLYKWMQTDPVRQWVRMTMWKCWQIQNYCISHGHTMHSENYVKMYIEHISADRHFIVQLRILVSVSWRDLEVQRTLKQFWLKHDLKPCQKQVSDYVYDFTVLFLPIATMSRGAYLEPIATLHLRYSYYAYSKPYTRAPAYFVGMCLVIRMLSWRIEHIRKGSRSMNLYFCRVPPRGSFRSSKTRESPGRLCLNGAGSQDLLLGFGTGLEGMTWATWCHNQSVGPWGFHPFLGVRGHQRQQQLPLLCCAWSSSFQPQTSGIPRTVPCFTQSWFRAIGQASASVQVACWCFSTEAGMTLTVFFSWTLAVWHGLCLGLA